MWEMHTVKYMLYVTQFSITCTLCIIEMHLNYACTCISYKVMYIVIPKLRPYLPLQVDIHVSIPPYSACYCICIVKTFTAYQI